MLLLFYNKLNRNVGVEKMEENKKSEGRELEDLLKEGDEIAKRLGPKVRNRMIEIADSGCKYINIALVLGGLAGVAALGIGEAYGLYKVPRETQLEYVFVSGAFGAMLSSFLGLGITNKMEERAYRRLQKEFPDKIEDIKRIYDLSNTYDYSQSASHPIG